MRLRQKRRQQAAFTIVELMLAVTIVAILAAIGTERYSAYIAQTRRSEAYAAIEALWNAQEAFYAENGVYIPDLRTIGFKLDQGNYVPGFPNQYQGKYYLYVVEVHPHTAQEWMVRATSGAGGTQDIDGDDYADVLVSGNIKNFNLAE